jgi:hypothetical protein
MSIDLQIQQECIHHGITRICHFTPSRKLAQIIAGQTGILATAHLEQSERHIFDPTDLQRLDGHKGHICCSIEYPNAWYLDDARAKEVLFKDWVILLIAPHYLWMLGTRFCYRNASAGCGRYIQDGISGFRSLFQSTVSGASGRIFQRGPTHLSSCPTDNQAEVLVRDIIKLLDLIGVVVQNEDQARNEFCRLRLQKLKTDLPFYIAPIFYDKYALSKCITKGNRPEERRIINEDNHGR